MLPDGNILFGLVHGLVRVGMILQQVPVFPLGTIQGLGILRGDPGLYRTFLPAVFSTDDRDEQWNKQIKFYGLLLVGVIIGDHRRGSSGELPYFVTSGD